MSKNGKFLSQKAVKKAKRQKGLLIALCVLLVLILAGLAFVYFFLDAKLRLITPAEIENRNPQASDYENMLGVMDDPEETDPTQPETQETTEPETTEAPTEPDYGKTGKIVNILLVGQDAREGEEAKLADTIILCTLNKETNKLTLTSFLRDSYLKMPDWKNENGYVIHPCGKNRINVNYALGYGWGGTGGAMKMLSECITNNFGVPIDGVVEVDFEAFVSVVRVLGGIEVDLTEDEAKYMTDFGNALRDERYHKTYEAGPIVLKGQPALWYARMRHSNYADSDIKRAGRQRELIANIISKVSKLSLLEINAMVDEILPKVSTNISVEDMKTYIVELLPLIFNLEVDSVQIPVEGSSHGVANVHEDIPGYVLQMDLDWNRRVIQEYAIDHE